MWRVVCALSVLALGAAAASLHPYVILAPDYGQGVRRSDGGPPADNIMVAWPSGVRLPPRQVPLRFVAAMAVPVNTDPLLTQKELSEVVYYSSMDLRKINGTAKKKEADVAVIFSYSFISIFIVRHKFYIINIIEFQTFRFETKIMLFFTN
jgi:hypothetical protein